MGKSTPQAPAPPNPYATSAAQTNSNVNTGIANAVIGNADTYGPQGSTVFNRIGSEAITDAQGNTINVPRYSSTTTLSPEQQQLYNQQTALGSSLNNLAQNQTTKLTGLLDQPVNTSGLPALAGSPDTKTTNYANGLTNDFSKDRTAVEDALFQRLNPQLERSRAALENSLVNQGFQRGTAAFNTAMDQANREANDARLAITAQGLGEQQGLYNMARDRAGFGSSEENRAFNTQLAGANFGNQARAQSLQELLALRNQPINEISALMSSGQVSLPNTPAYNAPQVANTDVAGNVYNSAALANQNYQTQLQTQAQKQAALFGALGGLGGAGLYGLAGGKLGGLFGRG